MCLHTFYGFRSACVLGSNPFRSDTGLGWSCPSHTHTRGELGSGRDCSQHLLSRVSGSEWKRQGPLKLFQPTETQDGVGALEK